MQGDFRSCCLDSVNGACAFHRDTTSPAKDNLGRGSDFGRVLMVPPLVSTKPSDMGTKGTLLRRWHGLLWLRPEGLKVKLRDARSTPGSVGLISKEVLR
jgi:hypothetical protein